MNLKAFKKAAVAESKTTTPEIGVELEIVHSDGRKVIITQEDLQDKILNHYVKELEEAVDAEMSTEDTDTFRANVIDRYNSMHENNTATVGDLLKEAKTEKIEKKVEDKKKEEEVENDLPVDLSTIAPHIGKLVVCHIVNPNMRSTKVGKRTVPSFGYIVTSGKTEENETVPDIMIHGSNMDAGMSLATKHGCVIKGNLDWDFSKERYQLRNIQMVQSAEVADTPVSVLSKWLDENIAFNANQPNVESVSWATLTKEVEKLHSAKVEDYLSENYPEGFILVEGKGNSQKFYYEKK